MFNLADQKELGNNNISFEAQEDDIKRHHIIMPRKLEKIGI